MCLMVPGKQEAVQENRKQSFATVEVLNHVHFVSQKFGLPKDLVDGLKLLYAIDFCATGCIDGLVRSNFNK